MKKTDLKLLLKSLCACIVFAASMIVVSVGLSLLSKIWGTIDSVALVVFSSIVSSILTLVVLTWVKMIHWGEAFAASSLLKCRSIPIVLLSVLVIFGLNLFSELLDLPDNNAQLSVSMVHNPLGVLVLVLIAPLVEELVFREAMVGYVLRHGGRPLYAILVSSLAFGLTHANPAQIPFAFMMGLLLAFLYCRTGSIAMSSFLHVLNNGLAVLLLLFCSEDATLTDYFPNSFVVIMVATVFVLVGYWGIWQLFGAETQKE